MENCLDGFFLGDMISKNPGYFPRFFQILTFNFETGVKLVAFFLCEWYNCFRLEQKQEGLFMSERIRVLGIAP